MSWGQTYLAINKYPPLFSWFVVGYSVGITVTESEVIHECVVGNICALVAPRKLDSWLDRLHKQRGGRKNGHIPNVFP